MYILVVPRTFLATPELLAQVKDPDLKFLSRVMLCFPFEHGGPPDSKHKALLLRLGPDELAVIKDLSNFIPTREKLFVLRDPDDVEADPLYLSQTSVGFLTPTRISDFLRLVSGEEPAARDDSLEERQAAGFDADWADETE